MLGKRSNIFKNSWVLSGDTERGRYTECFFSIILVIIITGNILRHDYP